MDKTATLSQNGDKTYNLLIQDEKGRVLVRRQYLSFYDAVRTIDETMQKEDEA